MDYDDKEFQGQNGQLAGEGCSKVAPVLHPYALPKFEFDDSFNRHLRFDNFVENEGFLGITNQEDNQWIEEYSRVSSSAVESRHNNVWYEATSSESVEMLLKSVGQEDKKDVTETIIPQSDINESGSLITKVMDPNINQDTIVISENHNLPVLEEKTDSKFGDVIQKEAENLANESMDKDMQEDHSIPNVADFGARVEESDVQENLKQVSVSYSNLSKNLSSDEGEQSIQTKENSMDVPMDSGTMSTKSSIPFSDQNLKDNMHEESDAASADAGNFENLNAKDPDSPESNVGSLTKISPIKNLSAEKNENAGNLPETGGILESVEGSKENDVKVYDIEYDVSDRVEQVAVMESDKRSSSDKPDGSHLLSAETDDQPKSPIFGVSLVHQDNKEKAEDGNSHNEILQVESVVASGSKNSSSLGEEVVHEINVHCVTPVENCNAKQIGQESETNNAGQKSFKTLETSHFESLEKRGNNSQTGGLQDPKESMIEVNNSNEQQTFVRSKDKQEATKDVTHDNSRSSKIPDDVENKIQSVSSRNATQVEKNFTFEVIKSGGLGQAGKDFQSFPTFQVSHLPKITEGPSTDSSSSQVDAKKLHEASVSPQNPSNLTTKVKEKSERKPRRKSVKKENVKSTLPVTGQVTHFEEVKPHEKVERGSTKPDGVLSSMKIPDLNNSASIFKQPFTDNQQVQLRAQILVYGSLISGSPPDEAHMIAAFGQSDGGRIWEGVWRFCLERIHVQKAQAKSNTPMQSRSDMKDAGSKSDQGIKQSSVQNKIPSSPIGGTTNKNSPPIISPMIPLSSPLWNISTPSQSSGMPKTSRLDYHQPLSPLHPYQTPPLHNLSGHNPSWLSQGPFAGQWVNASPIPALNTGPRFPPLPITEAVKVTPVKESGGPGIKHTSNPTVHNSPCIFPDASSLSGFKKSTFSSDQPSSDSKNRKRKKSTPKSGDQNVEKVVISQETLTKVEESKVQAEDATKHAAAAVNHCHGVWSQLKRELNSGLNSNDETKLVSSAVSIAAAAAVAKVAAAAAKIASDVAEQARSIIYPATSASSKHAESLNNAIVKAAEMAAEAVSQAGKIVAISEPMTLKHLVEAGPEGYWKTPRLGFKQQALIAGNLNGPETKNDETAPKVSDKGIPLMKSGDLAEKQTMEVDGISAPFTSHEKVKKKPRVRKGPELSKTIGAVSEFEIGSVDISGVGQTEPKVTLGTLKESNIKEGCLVEVYKDDDKYNGAWFGANVLSLKDGKALVCYTEIQSDEGSEQLKEWVPLKVEGSEVPKIRIAHPMTTMHLDGTRKRRRTAVTDFVWSGGDRVDVWIQDRWCEGVVVETNKIDVTTLTVQFPAQGKTSVVRSWCVRPTLIWKDGKWIECHTSEKHLSSQGDTPQEKRLKMGSPIVESKRDDGPTENVDLLDSRKQEESRTLSLSTHERVFNVGTARDDKKLNTHKTMSGLQKGPRVIFGVPKPGKKQKFMEVSKHYVADGTNKVNTTHDSVKFTRYLIPQAPGSRGWRNNVRSDAKEKQGAEIKSRIVRSRKPPITASRTVTSSKSTVRYTNTINKTGPDSVMHDENQSGHQNPVEIGSSSNIEDAPSTKSDRLNKRKFAPTGGKVAKVEKSLPENVEPRRSNRKIQPTSRLLEGLQSSMSISKIPAASHSTQRSHSKVTPKGNTNNT